MVLFFFALHFSKIKTVHVVCAQCVITYILHFHPYSGWGQGVSIPYFAPFGAALITEDIQHQAFGFQI